MKQKLLLLFCLFCVKANSQAPAVQMTKSYGGTLYEVANAVKQTSDGGYIIVGTAQSSDGDLTSGTHHGNSAIDDAWIVKTNTNGVKVWQTNLGGLSDDGFTCVQQTADGGYIVGGYTSSGDNGDVLGNHAPNLFDFWIIKLTATGSITWKKCLGATGDDKGYSVIQTTDGGYFAVGAYDNGSAIKGGIYRLDSTGATLSFQQTAGKTFRSIQQTSDGGYILAGSYSMTGFGSDFWLYKMTATGTYSWQQIYGGTLDDDAYSVKQTSDGGYIIAGSTYSSDGDVTGHQAGFNSDYWLVKTDSSGNLQWQKTAGGTGSDEAHDIRQTPDGGYAVVGNSASSNGDISNPLGQSDGWIVQFGPTGTLLWEKSVGTAANEKLNGMDWTSDQGIVAVGFNHPTVSTAATNFWLVKLEGICPPAPVAPASQTVCTTSTTAALTVTGTGVKWYTSVSGGTPLSASTTLTTGNYYVSQTVNGCESTRSTVAVTAIVTYVPLGSNTASFCNSAILGNLSVTGAEGSIISWYDAPTGGNELFADHVLVSGTTYYASQRTGNCESGRKAVTVTITIADPPIVTPVNNCSQSPITIATLNQQNAAQGTDIKWYLTETGGSVLASNSIVNTGTYYASQTINGCTSPRVAVPVNSTVIAANVTQTGGTLTVQAVNNTHYQWVTCPSYQSIDGATGLSFTPATTGGYAVLIMSNTNGCTALSSCFSVTPLGLSENLKDTLEVYPNPATSELHFSGLKNNASYQIFNSLGQEVLTGTIKNNSIVISNILSGIYFVKIMQDDQSAIKRFIKQ